MLSMLCKSLDRKSGNHLTVHWDAHSIKMLNKNAPGVKNARPSWKHQLALTYIFDYNV